jgi:Na+-driven multidrug efflux pump
MDSLIRLAKNSAWMMFLLNLPVLAILVIFGENLLMLFGQEFIEAYPYLLIIMFGQFVNLLTGSVSYLLSLTGNEIIVRNVVLATGAMSIFLNIVLGWRFGLAGISFATSIVFTVNNLTLAYFVYRKLGFVLIPGLQWMK